MRVYFSEMRRAPGGGTLGTQAGGGAPFRRSLGCSGCNGRSPAGGGAVHWEGPCRGWGGAMGGALRMKPAVPVVPKDASATQVFTAGLLNPTDLSVSSLEKCSMSHLLLSPNGFPRDAVGVY